MSDGTEEGNSIDGLTSSSPAQEQPQKEIASSTPATANNDDAPRYSSIAERLGNPESSGRTCEDEPPSYASLVNASADHHRVTWSYVFPSPAYEASPEGRTIARPLVSIPLTSYGIFKIEPPRYAAAMGQTQMQYPRVLSEPRPPVKSSHGKAPKYGAILIAATVILFLMVLSLMVRFVTEKSLWKG